jgi:dihydrofolate reductase
MRKVIESTLLSLDGVIGEPMAWANDYFGEEAQENALEQLLASDAMLMGRRTYEIFSAQWPQATGAYADRLNGMRKYVFSSTLRQAEWQNTTIISDDPVTAVAKLKSEPGNDLVMYGHGPLGQALLEHGLLDELHFAVHPVMVGHGATLLRESQAATLQLVGTRTLGTGVTVLSYRPRAA